MLKMSKNHIITIILTSLFVVTFLLFPVVTQKNEENTLILTESNIQIGDSTFKVTIADTPRERTKGLSGRKELSSDEGLIFVFEKPGIYPFWMKEMNFPIDIIWIGEDLHIAYIKENATPESFPETFTPDTLSLYALEVNTGTVAKKKIKIGDEVFLNFLDGE